MRAVLTIATLACAVAVAAPVVAMPTATSPVPMKFWMPPEDGPEAIRTAGQNALQELQGELFGDLEADIAALVRSGERLPDGRLRLEAIRLLLSRTVERSTQPETQALAPVRKWQKELPNSTAAPIFEAITWSALAWSARGHTYTSGVREEGARLFRERLIEAERVLREHKARCASNPLWYLEAMVVGLGLGRGDDYLQALYREGIARFPDADMLSRQMVVSLSPRWGGSYERVRRFVTAAVAAAPADRRAELYARLYWQLRETQQLGAGEFFKMSGADWSRMRQGFEALAERYPASHWNLNHYAAFACAAGDRATYARVRGRLGTTVYGEAWFDRYPSDVCDARWSVTLAATSALPTTGFERMRKPADPNESRALFGWDAMRYAHLVEKRDFAALETALTQAATLRTRYSDGTTELYAAREGLADYLSNAQYAAPIRELLGDWRDRAPASATQPVVEAIYWRASAWSLRQEHEARDSGPTQRRLFLERLRNADRVLAQSETRGAGNPLWYQERLAVARGLGWKRAAMREQFDRGIARHPDYLPLYEEMIASLLPMWGGSYRAVEEFAASMSTSQQKSFPGDELYARLYWYVSATEDCGCERPFQLFRDSPVSWPRMKSGFDAMLRRYPSSIYDANAYAVFACLAGDRGAYQAMRAKIGLQIYTHLWPGNARPEVCDRALLHPVGA